MRVTHKAVHIPPWYVYPLELELIDNGDLFFTENTRCSASQIKKIEKLPTEFFVHQLQDINVDKVDSIKEFCEKWGVVCAPYFQSKERFSVARESDPSLSRRRRAYQEMYRLDDSTAELGNELLKSTISTPSSEACARFLEHSVVKSENFRRQLCKQGALHGGAISYDEVRNTLILIRDAIAIISAVDYQNDFIALIEEFAQEDFRGNFFLENVPAFDSSSSDASPKEANDRNKAVYLNHIEPLVCEAATTALHFLNATAYPNGALFGAIECEASLRALYTKQPPQGSLSEAICLQFFNTLSDSASWHICENETCRNRFKYRQNSAEGSVDTRLRESRYCRVNCGNIQRRRNKARSTHYEIVESPEGQTKS